ncbi:MAG: hypothetical protein Q8M29_05880 [Bacteroidota bacterium]|nr:hypothetical protein [Bacteroidota bacterium]
MKKKIFIYTIVLVLAGITAFILIKKNNKSTLNSESAQFDYQDTAKISKIVIQEKNGTVAILEKNKQGVWMINGKYPAKKKNVELLLYTLKQVQVKYPASQKAIPTVIGTIATIGKKVEFYDGPEKVKVWYLGGTSPDQRGTYMVLGDNESDEKEEQPYATYIPGFEGFLDSRFFTGYNDWKSNTVLNTTPPEISNIIVEHAGMPDSSFIINVHSVNKFSLTDLNKKNITNPDTFAIKQYLTYCSILDVDYYLTGQSDREVDSVKKSIPFTTITINMKNGTQQKMKLFSKKPTVDQTDPVTGIKLVKDPNHAYMLFNNDQEFALVQYLVFGKLIQSRQYFLRPSLVKK